MTRVGIRFLPLAPADQAALDRLLFLLLQLESRSRRHLRGNLYRAPRPEQRRHHRAPAPPTVTVRCSPAGNDRQLDTAAQARALAGAGAPCCEATLLDLSGAGCAVLCPSDQAPREQDLVELEIELVAEQLRLRVQGRVVHARPERRRITGAVI